jgi:internalin A
VLDGCVCYRCTVESAGPNPSPCCRTRVMSQYQFDNPDDAYREAQRRIADAADSGTTSLKLSRLGLASVPPEIGKLTSPVTLSLQNNRLTSVPPVIGLLSRLKHLWLHNNQLTSVPSEIGRLACLSAMSVSGNRLTSLPPEIGQLSRLTELYLYDNQLTSVPSEIGLLSRLAKLDLDHNQLKSVPPEVGRLAKLTELNLQMNALTALPDELSNLRKLTWLFLHDNPGLKLSPDVLGGDIRESADNWASPQSILDFYFSREADTAFPLDEVKMILVGRGGAGKTCTVRSLLGEPFNDDEESTSGIALSDWIMEDCKKGPVTAHVWDFAGQVMTHALHQFFFSVRSVYVLVLTGRENSEREDAEYWLRLIKAFGTDEHGEGPPVIVALNKWDLTGCRPKVDRGALQERYPFIRRFIQLDCESGTGVKQLKAALTKEVDQL